MLITRRAQVLNSSIHINTHNGGVNGCVDPTPQHVVSPDHFHPIAEATIAAKPVITIATMTPAAIAPIITQ